MQRISVTRNIPEAIERVWAVLADLGTVHAYHPMVASSPVTSENVSGLGATRICHFHDGKTLTERVVYYEEKRGYTVALLEGSMPFKEAFGHIRVRGDSRATEVSFELAFQPRYGVLGWAMAQVMLKPMLRRMMRDVLAGLAVHLRSADSMDDAEAAGHPSTA